MPLEAPGTEVTIDEPLAPSALTALGVTESITGTAAGGERAVRSVTATVGACVKSVVEREPQLRGTMSFRLELGPRSEVKPASGALGGHSAASCIRDALRGAVAASGSEGSIDYTLTFGGAYTPQPIPAGSLLDDQWVGLDWSAAGAEVPTAVAPSSVALREPLRRCAFGAEPNLTEGLWLVLRVAKGGAVTLGPTSPSDASDCIQRTLRAATFPDAGHDYALSVMLTPTVEPVAANEPPNGEQQEFGMIGLLNSGAGAGSSDDATSARGNMWGDEIGDSFGAGGLGLVGIGEGGGGIGLGSIGTIGHGAGTGTGQGFGNGNGRLGGAHRSKPPSVKLGATSVAGRLPPEVIQRIVRQNFGRFRLCYEIGLRKAPKLAGKISVSFEITRKGSTAKISSTSDMKDKAVVSCVEKAFVGLSFPQPEGGVVKVTYPIMFSPGDDDAAKPAAPAAPPPPQTIGGKPIASIGMVDLEKRLVAKGFLVAPVPGFSPGQSPALFLHHNGLDLYSLTLGPKREGLRGPLCTAGDRDRMLYVRGDQCQRVLGQLLD